MTKFLNNSLLVIGCLLLIILIPSSVSASTDTIPATISATARVPSASPTTGDITAPPAVILIAPHDGATTNQSKPEFVWKQTFDSNSNLVSYTLYLNGVATYLGISNTGNSQQNNYISHIGDGNIYLTPTLDLPAGSYDWHIRATDGSNNSSYSTTWHFTIDQTPPSLVVVNIDDVYLNPNIAEGTIFGLPGPQEVKIVFATEPYATVSVTLSTTSGNSMSYSLPTDSSGIATLFASLPLGQHQIIVTSFDRASLTTTLPGFYLNLTSKTIPGISITPSLPSLVRLTNLPSKLTSLPATISQIQDKLLIAFVPYTLLAVGIILLLIYLWHRRYNILILDQSTNKPYRSLILYHSRPTHSAIISSSLTRLFVTNREPILYQLDNTGRAYVHNLGRYSSLTIRTPDGDTHIMSLSIQQRKYVIYI